MGLSGHPFWSNFFWILVKLFYFQWENIVRVDGRESKEHARTGELLQSMPRLKKQVGVALAVSVGVARTGTGRFDPIPNDTLPQILAELPFAKKVMLAMTVCKEFWNLRELPELWQSISAGVWQPGLEALLHPGISSTSSLLRLIEWLQHPECVTSFSLGEFYLWAAPPRYYKHGKPNAVEALIEALSQLPALTSLAVFVPETATHLLALIATLNTTANLTTLTLSSSGSSSGKPPNPEPQTPQTLNPNPPTPHPPNPRS